MRAITDKNVSVGIIVAKKMNIVLNMLIDQLALNGYVDAGLSWAPSFAVAFLTEDLRQRSRRLWGAHSKKRLPFFCADYLKPIGAPEVMRLGLSACDF